MTKLILFSGGVESTALLTQAKPEDVLLTIQPTYPNDRPTYRTSYAEDVASFFGFRIHYAGATIPFEEVPYNFVHQMRTFVSLANLWVAKDSRITEVWCGRNCKEPSPKLIPFIEQMMEAWKVLHPQVAFLHPLDHLTKKEQWDMIPVAIRDKVSSCVFHRNCGTCKKCLELVCLSENLQRATKTETIQ